MPGAMLPVVMKNHETALLVWGRREHEAGNLPLGGWARHESILKGTWNKYQPVPVKIAVAAFMEKDKQKKSHWFDLEPGQVIQGLLARAADGQQRVYVVTVEPEDKSIHDRWPRIVDNPEQD